jgi:hypothetical protein
VQNPTVCTNHRRLKSLENFCADAMSRMEVRKSAAVASLIGALLGCVGAGMILGSRRSNPVRWSMLFAFGISGEGKSSNMAMRASPRTGGRWRASGEKRKVWEKAKADATSDCRGDHKTRYSRRTRSYWAELQCQSQHDKQA